MSYVVLAAGGTGGHIHAALAIGERFQSFGMKICYFSGDRYLDYQLLKDYRTVHLKASALKGKGVLRMVSAILSNLKAFCTAFLYFCKERPAMAIGVGGYIGGPVLMAAFLQGVPIFVLEQNGILGLTNKLLFPFVKKIFVHFQETKGIPKWAEHKIIVSGNPIRSDFFYTKFTKNRDAGPLRVVVFGGSLGATPINMMIQEFIKETPPFPIHIIHQRGKKVVEVNQATLSPLITYEQREFFDTIVNEYQWCDLIICRSGASTMAELRVVQKPCLLIPYPHHADRQQFFNAEFLKKEVSFPVYIKSCEELMDQRGQALMAILQEVWQEKASDKKTQEEKWVRPLATSIIFEEMVKYVRS